MVFRDIMVISRKHLISFIIIYKLSFFLYCKTTHIDYKLGKQFIFKSRLSLHLSLDLKINY